MKNSVKAALAVGVVAAGYLGGTWMLGSKIEPMMVDANAKMAAQMPMLKFSDHKFERGLFRSTSSDKVTVMLAGMPVSFLVKSTIKNGPITGFGLGAAQVNTEVSLDGASPLGGGAAKTALLTAQTSFGLSGSEGNTLVTIPGYDSPIASWGGLTMKVKFATDMSRYTMQGDIPKAEVHAPNGLNMKLDGFHMAADQQRLFNDDPNLFGGTFSFGFAQLDFTQGEGAGAMSVLSAKAFTSDATAGLNGKEFVDVAVKNAFQNLQVVNQEYGPAHLDIAVNHLNAKAMSQLARMNSEMSAQAPTPEQVPQILALAQNLFKQNAEFKVDRLSFTTPQGEALATAVMTVTDPEHFDLSNPDALTRAIGVKGDAKVPEAFVQTMQKTFMGANQNEQQMNAMRDMIVAAGYVIRDGAMLKTTLEYKDAQVTLNGKLLAPPQQAAPAPKGRH